MTVLLFSSFVSEVVHLYYKDDDAVEEDEEIQAFVKDVHNFGMQDFESCGECIEAGVFKTQQQHSRQAGAVGYDFNVVCSRRREVKRHRRQSTQHTPEPVRQTSRVSVQQGASGWT